MPRFPSFMVTNGSPAMTNRYQLCMRRSKAGLNTLPQHFSRIRAPVFRLGDCPQRVGNVSALMQEAVVRLLDASTVSNPPLADVEPSPPQCRQWPNTRPSNYHCVRQEIGHCRHWGGAQPTSAMWRIADGSGVEHPGGCFLYQRYSHSRPVAVILFYQL